MRAGDLRKVLLFDFSFDLALEEILLEPVEAFAALDLDALAFERDVLDRFGFVDPDRRIVRVVLGLVFFARLACLQESHEFSRTGVAHESGAITRGRRRAEPALPVAHVDEDLFDIVGREMELRTARLRQRTASRQPLRLPGHPRSSRPVEPAHSAPRPGRQPATCR